MRVGLFHSIQAMEHVAATISVDYEFAFAILCRLRGHRTLRNDESIVEVGDISDISEIGESLNLGQIEIMELVFLLEEFCFSINILFTFRRFTACRHIETFEQLYIHS